MEEQEQLDGQVEYLLRQQPTTDELLAISELGTQPLPLSSYAGGTLEVVVAGYINLDILPTLPATGVALAPGQLIEAGKAVLSPGGPVASTGLALQRLGVPTRLLGKVGNDSFGQILFQLVAAQGDSLTRGMVISVAETSSYSIILNPPRMERLTIHSAGCNATFSADDIAYELLGASGIFHFCSPLLMPRMYEGEGEELAKIFQRVKALDVTTSLAFTRSDSSTGQAPWPTILANVLPNVDIFLADIEELLHALRRPSYEKLSAKAGKTALIDLIAPDQVAELGHTLLELGAKIVGINLGQRGFYLCTRPADQLAPLGHAQPTKLMTWGGRELWAPCFVSETVNMGKTEDVAGFLMGFLRGMGPEATLAATCAVGACSMESSEPLGGLKSWQEILERIAAGWTRRVTEKKKPQTLDMQAYKWRWDERHELWLGPGDQHY